MLQNALKYLSQGLSVIPLKPSGKTPLIAWQEFQKRKATESEVKEWFQKWPNANLGIVTGTISGIVIVDLDGPEGLAEAARLGIKSVVVSLTGNGKHLWFRVPLNAALISNAVRTYPGVDIRGEGGYIVAPPSIHESGRRYRWLKPWGVNFVNSLSPLPMEFLKQDIATVPTVGKEDGWVAKALREMTNGNIDDTLFTVCSRLRGDGYSRDDARTLLAPHANMVGAEAGHLDEKIENVWKRYEPRTKTEGQMRLYKPYEQSLVMPSNDLVIHFPTNPDSIRQYESSKLDVEAGDSNLRTGYLKLDQMLQGGLKSSRLLTIAARTGVGKTNWLLGVAREVCRSGKVVLLFSTEMPYSQIWERYISMLEDGDEFKQHKFYVCDSFAPNLERVEEAINEIKPDVFMFDHINHVSEEQRELGAFMQGLNYIRRKYECAGMVTAQLNRSADWVDLKTGEKVTPRMSMIKGSGTIEQASSRVLLLSETRITPEGTEIVGNLDKNDNGPKGLLHFILRSNPYRMEEV